MRASGFQLEDLFQSKSLSAIKSLLAQGETLYLVSQVVREFWNVCTRPLANNGLGMTIQEASEEMERLEAILPFLPDTPMTYTHWRELVARHSVRGVQVHDANLVAAMLANEITHLLTFNVADFQRFSEIIVASPNQGVN
ncbi:MAG: PIN domain-containing protein [Armatimonadetes bacterium]|nr:PIN domain-containing protein [Armatimonadota bacterium]